MKNRGITLVALVVTVIILLIIAGVAVSMITGNDGLFSKTNESAAFYNEEARKEAEVLNGLIDSGYLPGATGENGNNSNIVEKPLSNGSFNEKKKVNSPDVSKLPVESLRYLIWSGNGPYTKQVLFSEPDEWYDYANGQWANILTTANGLEAAWVWIPRFAYRLVEVGNKNEKEIEVIFVKNNSKIGVLSNGTEVQCYYTTDTEITANGTGLYTDSTDLAKGTGQDQAWIIHPAFWWDNNNNLVRDANEELNGIWIAKFEPSNNGGKVEVRDALASWRSITLKKAFEVSREMQNTGGVIGTITGNTQIDTHMAKTIEWGAISILTNSKFGIYNPKSDLNGENTRKRVWTNPTYTTGLVSSTKYTGSNDSSTRDANTLAFGNCDRYNIGNGPKGSSTGTVYGVYDLAGCGWEYVLGVLSTDNSITSTTPTVAVNSSGYSNSADFTSKIERKYYDAYKSGSWNSVSGRGYIGDALEEFKPTFNSSRGYAWFEDRAFFVDSSHAFFRRGGCSVNGTEAGTTAFERVEGGAYEGTGFRPILLVL